METTGGDGMKAENWKCLSGSALKLLAAITMLIDHGALIFSAFLTGQVVYVLRQVGRLAFPIFCFLAAEGYVHTRNKKRYAWSLLLFALISEVPFDLMLRGSLSLDNQNIYFTMFFGVLMMFFYENTDGLKRALLMLCVGVTTILLDVDYGIRGVLLIFLLYVLRGKPFAKTALAFPLLSGGWAAFAAFIPINLYNGKRGFIQTSWLKYSFYVFYPAHILLLLLIRSLL